MHWTLLQRRIDYRRLAADMGTAASLSFVGDLLCQSMEARAQRPQGSQGLVQHDHQIDTRRLASLTTFNALYSGGIMHFLNNWYPSLVSTASRRALPASSRVTALLTHKRSLAHSLACACVDNVHCGLIYIPTYFLAVGIMQGNRAADAYANLSREWWPTYASCTGFWVPFMWANFTLVPAVMRVKAIAVGNLGWNVVIDYLAHRGCRQIADGAPGRPA